jgi:drug/metabolite transporter (DMT)-like permease
VRDYLKAVELPLLWALFFLTTVYGHVALKFAVRPAAGDGPGRALLQAFASLWGLSALGAWSASCLLWALVLARQELLSANNVASLRYLLIGLAAWLWVGERATGTQIVGMLLIAVGTWLAK